MVTRTSTVGFATSRPSAAATSSGSASSAAGASGSRPASGMARLRNAELVALERVDAIAELGGALELERGRGASHLLFEPVDRGRDFLGVGPVLVGLGERLGPFEVIRVGDRD